MSFSLTAPRSSILPAGLRIYAIGDIHGEAALLVRLLRRIEADNIARGSVRVVLIFLGDLIDRGPDGAMLVQLLSRLTSEEVIVLKGNHEAGLVEAYHGDEAALGGWLSFGGLETLAGFGIIAHEMSNPAELIEAMRTGIGAPLIGWLSDLPTHWQCGDYFFAHAGIRPGVRLDWQKTDDLMWIREPFLSSRKDHGRVIVHGHSVEPGLPRLGSNRIGIDTGGHEHGTLTALGLEGGRQWLLQAERSPKPIADNAFRSTDPESPSSITSAIRVSAGSEEVDALIASIVAAGLRHQRPIAPLLELTSALRFKSVALGRTHMRLGNRGLAASAFALILIGLGIAGAFYDRGRAAHRPPQSAVISELSSITYITPSLLPTAPALRHDVSRPRSNARKVVRSDAKKRVTAHNDDTSREPRRSMSPGDQPSPRLHGTELEEALAKDRIITRQRNTGELARVQASSAR